MTTRKQDGDFLSDVLPDDLLERAISWIAHNLEPGDVFGSASLELWALDNGFVRDE